MSVLKYNEIEDYPYDQVVQSVKDTNGRKCYVRTSRIIDILDGVNLLKRLEDELIKNFKYTNYLKYEKELRLILNFGVDLNNVDFITLSANEYLSIKYNLDQYSKYRSSVINNLLFKFTSLSGKDLNIDYIRLEMKEFYQYMDRSFAVITEIYHNRSLLRKKGK